MLDPILYPRYARVRLEEARAGCIGTTIISHPCNDVIKVFRTT